MIVFFLLIPVFSILFILNLVKIIHFIHDDLDYQKQLIVACFSFTYIIVAATLLIAGT